MEISQIYDEYVAEHFDEDLFHIYQEARQTGIRQIQKRCEKGKYNILDLGMGTGDFLISMHELYPGSSLSGMEISKKMIDLAEKKFKAKKDMKVKSFFGHIEEIDQHVQRETIDIAALHFVLNYVDHKKILSEIHALLRPGGLLSLSTATQDCFSILRTLASQFTSEEYVRAQFNVPKNIEETRRLLEGAGYQIVEAEIFTRNFSFVDIDQLHHFALHSGWVVNEFFINLTEEQISLYREMTKSLFPLSETFKGVILLAKK